MPSPPCVFRHPIRALLIAVAGVLLATHGHVAQAVETPQAAQVLDRLLGFMGGEKAVYGIVTLVVSSDSERDTPLGVARVPTRIYYAFPLSVRRESTINGRMIAMASTPTDGGVMFTQSGAAPLEESLRVAMEKSTMRDPVVLLKSRIGRGFTATYVGAEGGSTPADIVKIAQNENETTLVVARDDGRLVEIRYALKDDEGRNRSLVVRFDAWTRHPSGLVYPYRVRGFEQGQQVLEARVRDVQVNVPLAETLFSAGIGPARGGRR